MEIDLPPWMTDGGSMGGIAQPEPIKPIMDIPILPRESSGPKFRRRCNQFGNSDDKAFIPGVPPFIPNALSEREFDLLLKRVRIEEITHKLSSGQLEMADADRRSPSPEPVYGRDGKRMNTRDKRITDKLTIERQGLIQECMKLNPGFKPPADYKPVAIKKERKIYIPADEYPEYNFIGLIIGPRGMTQKSMEKETGAKIAIRGKGSVKEGRKMDGKGNNGEDDKLHVLIQGDTEESIERAARMVEALLVPVEEDKNEHKRLQLRKLAEINGTLRESLVPRRTKADDEFVNYVGPDVRCGVCGDASHVTADCPLKDSVNPRKGYRSKVDDEYNSFLSEISGGGGGPRRTVNKEVHENAYADFMKELEGGGGGGNSQPPQQQMPPWQPQQQGGYGGGGGGGGGGGYGGYGQGHSAYGPPQGQGGHHGHAQSAYGPSQGHSQYSNQSHQSHASHYGPPQSSYGQPAPPWNQSGYGNWN